MVWILYDTVYYLFNYQMISLMRLILQLIGEARTCAILERSLERFYSRAFPGKLSSRSARSICRNDGACTQYFGGLLNKVEISFISSQINGCEHFPHAEMNEKCKYLCYCDMFSLILKLRYFFLHHDRTRAVFGRAYFRKIFIFVPCLFKKSIDFEALLFQIYLMFWLVSMYSRHVYGSNIPLKYTVMLWYLQLHIRNRFSMFSKFQMQFIMVR